MKEKRVRSIFLRSISSTSELVGKCATRKPKLGFLWNFWCHSYFPLETAPRSEQFTPLLPLLREIIKAEWCQIVKLNLYVTYYVMIKFCVHCPNVSTTPIRAMECRQCLPLSVVQLKGKHCGKLHCCNEVVDTLSLHVLLCP